MIVIVDLSTGTGSFVRDLALGLRRFHSDDFVVSLVTFRDQDHPESDRRSFDSTRSLGMQVRESWRQTVELPIAVGRLRAAIRDSQPDVILSVHTFSNLVASMAGDDLPVILTDHLNLSKRQAARGVAGAMRWMLKRIYARRMVVGVSAEITQDLRENFGARRTATILNGVDLDRIRAAADEPATVNLPDRYVVAVGRLVEQKDLPTLISAHASARLKGMPEHLVLVGSGPERDRLEQLCHDLGTRHQVHFVEHQANPFPIMKGARFLTMSSVYEGFGLVLAEAMALGVPCVSTNCPSGPAEILGNGEFGILVPVRDSEQLAAAMLKLSGDDSCRVDFSQRALARAEAFSSQRMAREYRDLILAELKNSRSSE